MVRTRLFGMASNQIRMRSSRGRRGKRWKVVIVSMGFWGLGQVPCSMLCEVVNALLDESRKHYYAFWMDDPHDATQGCRAACRLTWVMRCRSEQLVEGTIRAGITA